MKKILLAAFVVVLALSLSVNAQDKNKTQTKKQTVTTVDSKDKAAKTEAKVFNKVCPVSGETLENNNVTYTYNGKTYGLCCKNAWPNSRKIPQNMPQG